MTNIFTRRLSLPGFRWAEKKVRSLSITGKLVFGICATIFIVSSLVLLAKVNASFLVEVPRQGGTLVEGVVGVPRFINPLLAVTDGDKDLVSLIYSGLMRQLPDGSLIPDLADHYTVSPDGKTYDFVIRKNAVFQDGTLVTADDIIFTIQAAQNPQTKSPKQAVWAGITVTKINDQEVTFTLSQPYAPFLENTTLGILPHHLFTNPSADMSANTININPVGSGPYKVSSIAHDGNNIPSSYTLSSFNKFTLGQPKINTMVLKFFDNEQDLVSAYENGDIAAMNSISPNVAAQLQSEGARIIQASLPRIFATFFNQTNNPALAHAEVRQALAMSVDRGYITDTVLRGFGTPLINAVPQSFVKSLSLTSASSTTSDVAGAIRLLEKNGWVLNSQGIREKKFKNGTTTLSFSISTSDAPELKQVADILESEWHAIGADVTVKVFEGGYLNQNIIRPRKYDALLFGQVVNRDLDLYAFWHSSEVNDPGLNVALYSNKKADTLLESMRIIGDRTIREKAFGDFANLLKNDNPAVFLYSPSFIYVISPQVQNISLDQVSVPSDRFGSVYTWYMETDKIWKIFAHNN